MSVVAIDDDAALGRALERSLVSMFPGLDVYATTDHRHAFDGPPPDVVLVDLHMPVANGLEVCMELMAIPESRRPLIVAMSANASAADIDVLHSIGVRHFMPKDEHFVSEMGALIARVRNGESHAPRSSP